MIVDFAGRVFYLIWPNFLAPAPAFFSKKLMKPSIGYKYSNWSWTHLFCPCFQNNKNSSSQFCQSYILVCRLDARRGLQRGGKNGTNSSRDGTNSSSARATRAYKAIFAKSCRLYLQMEQHWYCYLHTQKRMFTERCGFGSARHETSNPLHSFRTLFVTACWDARKKLPWALPPLQLWPSDYHFSSRSHP